MQWKSSLLTVHPLYNNHRNWTVGTYYFNFYDNNINWKERECKLLFIYALLPHPHILYSKETVGCCLFPKESIQLDFRLHLVTGVPLVVMTVIPSVHASVGLVLFIFPLLGVTISICLFYIYIFPFYYDYQFFSIYPIG